MGLRLREGIDPAGIENRFGVPVIDRAKAERLVEGGFLVRKGTRIAPTAKGQLVLDRLLAELAT